MRSYSQREKTRVLADVHAFNEAHRDRHQHVGPLTRATILVLTTILFRMPPNGYPSQERIARAAKCSTVTVRRALRALEQSGIESVQRALADFFGPRTVIQSEATESRMLEQNTPGIVASEKQVTEQNAPVTLYDSSLESKKGSLKGQKTENGMQEGVEIALALRWLSGADVATRFKWKTHAEELGMRLPPAAMHKDNLSRWVPAIAAMVCHEERLNTAGDWQDVGGIRLTLPSFSPGGRV